MKIFVLHKNPYIDLTFTGEWKFKREYWKDTYYFTEYYFGPFLLRYFHEKMVDSNDPTRSEWTDD